MHQLITPHATVQIVTCTKKLVDALLAMNTRNRTAKPAPIERLKNDMLAGKFLLTASGVGVTKNGTLSDGQHRLLAMRAAGYPAVRFVLMTGLEDEAQLVIDRHVRRNLADSLAIFMNLTVTNRVVALAQALHCFSALEGRTTAFTIGKTQLSDSQVGAFVSEHSELIAEICSASRNVKAPVMAAMFVYFINEKDRAAEFARQVHDGLHLSEDDPAYKLRQTMDRLKSANGTSGRAELFKAAARAVVAHAKDERLKILRPLESWEIAPRHWGFRK